MKLLMFLSLVAFANSKLSKHLKLTPEGLIRANKINDNCLIEHGLKDAEVDKLTAENYTTKRSIGCHIHCFVKNMGLWDQEDGYNLGVIKELEIDDQLFPVIDECIQILYDDKCMESLHAYHCYLKNAPRTGLRRY